MEFRYAAYIPSIDDFTKARQLTTSNYIELVKYISNGNKQYIAAAYDEVLQDLCPEVELNSLTKLDKFFLLLTIRAISVGPLLSLSFDVNGKQATARISLLEMLQKLADIEYPAIETIKISDNVKVGIRIPETLYEEDTQTMALKCINNISIGDRDMSLVNLGIDEKLQLIDALPGSFYKQFINYINRGVERYSSVELFKIHGSDEPYTVNVFNNTLFDFVNLCYGDSLSYIKDALYVLVKICNFDSNILMNSTFAEIRMYIDMYEEELKQRKKQEEKQNNKFSSPAVGSPVGLNL